MKYFLPPAIFFFFIQCLAAQNLVPNPSFEKVKKDINRWTSNHVTFETLVDHWLSPNEGSPDILYDRELNLLKPPRKGYDLSQHKARTGNRMVGIKTYGCATFTQHCKEYVQIELKEKLERGQKYYVEFWVNPMSTSPYTNNLGAVFSDVEIQDAGEYGIYYFDPVVNTEKLVTNRPNDWYKISGAFTADDNYKYLLIGNFYPDDFTLFQKEEGDIRYAYYLLDDVLVRPASLD